MEKIKITDKINFYNCDCMEFMKTIPDQYYDLAIVDPPYNLGNKLVNGGTWAKKWKEKGADWDIAPKKEYFEELFRVSKNWIIWGGNYFIENLPNCRNFISWHKPYMDGMHSMSNVELALTSFDMNAKSIDFNKDSGIERIHVCQKPVQLYKWLLQKYAKEGDKILDTHLGSGSIACAIHEWGGELDACELDKDYFDNAVKRVKEYTKQQLLF
jgi:site-specific DNA-methyltransferase (adenine-specific)